MKSLLLLVLGATFVSACTTARPDDTPEAPTSATLAPRSAHVAATILQCSDRDDRFDCTLRVEQVHAYGAATRPLSRGTELDVRVRKTLLEDASASSTNTWHEGQRLTLTLQHQEGVATADGPVTVWRVIRIH